MSLTVFNEEKHFLGVLCRRGHEYEGTGQTVRSKGSRECLICAHMWREANKDKRNAKKRERRRNNPEVTRKETEYHNLYMERLKTEDPEKIERFKQLRKENYWKNRDKKLAQQKVSRQSDNRVRIPKSGSSTYNQRMLEGELELFTNADWKQHCQKFGNACAYCGNDQNLVKDHLIPLSKGGPTTLRNLVPCCRSCNYSKHRYMPLDWYPKQPFYSLDRWSTIIEALGIEEDRSSSA